MVDGALHSVDKHNLTAAFTKLDQLTAGKKFALQRQITLTFSYINPHHNNAIHIGLSLATLSSQVPRKTRFLDAIFGSSTLVNSSSFPRFLFFFCFFPTPQWVRLALGMCGLLCLFVSFGLFALTSNPSEAIPHYVLSVSPSCPQLVRPLFSPV